MCVGFLALVTTGCKAHPPVDRDDPSRPLTLVVEQPPLTLNPRSALDASGQRIGALLYAGLTRIGPDLDPQPDLAESWNVSKDGRTWKFRIAAGKTDHRGEPIDALRIAQCLDEYRLGKPASRMASAFPSWRSTRADSGRSEVVIELDRADPYLARNISLFRYFRTGGAPCRETEGVANWTGSGPFKPSGAWTLTPDESLDLIPAYPSAGLKPVRLLFVREEGTRALMMLRGLVDVIQNGLSLTKTRWIEREHGDRFQVIEREGVGASYLAFNLQDRLLSDLRVRRAIALAIPREDIVRHKMFGFGTLGGSLLSPALPESTQVPLAYDPELSRRLLDDAGYPVGPDGLRFTLHYRTTTAREGQEQALVFKDALSRIGVRIVLEVVEPAVFLASIRRGGFQLFSSRWVGVSDGSILFRTLHSKQLDNRARYKSPEMDALLEAAMAETDPRRRTETLAKVQRKMAEDLPYVPLWYWSNAVIVRRELARKIDPAKLSRSGAYDSLIYQLAR